MWLEAGLGTPSELNDSACMMLTKDLWREALVLLQMTAPAIGKQGSVERAFIRLCLKCTCVALRNLDLLIKTVGTYWPDLLLRTLVVGRRQQSESIEAALDME